jgi:hypothetical protein
MHAACSTPGISIPKVVPETRRGGSWRSRCQHSWALRCPSGPSSKHVRFPADFSDINFRMPCLMSVVNVCCPSTSTVPQSCIHVLAGMPSAHKQGLVLHESRFNPVLMLSVVNAVPYVLGCFILPWNTWLASQLA